MVAKGLTVPEFVQVGNAAHRAFLHNVVEKESNGYMGQEIVGCRTYTVVTWTKSKLLPKEEGTFGTM